MLRHFAPQFGTPARAIVLSARRSDALRERMGASTRLLADRRSPL
jgi:hypothetical protein